MARSKRSARTCASVSASIGCALGGRGCPTGERFLPAHSARPARDDPAVPFWPATSKNSLLVSSDVLTTWFWIRCARSTVQHSARGQSRVSASRRCAGELPGNSVRSASTKEWKRKIGLWLVVAWVAVVLGATSSARADYAGPVHSDEQIKQLMGIEGLA